MTINSITTDIAAHVLVTEVKLKERWKYEPLVFAIPSSTHKWSETKIDIYPNPAHDVLNINVKAVGAESNLIAHIINTEGKIVSDTSIKNDSNSLDISALNSGVYTVKVLDQNQIVFVSKFIKIQ